MRIECGSGDVQRPLGRENTQVERLDLARGIAERGHDSARAQTIQRFQEGVLADTIVDGCAFFAVSDFHHPCREIFSGIINDVIAAMGLGKFALFIAANRADDIHTQMLRPLAKDQANTPGRCVNQNGIARLHGIGTAQEILRGHALEHD